MKKEGSLKPTQKGLKTSGLRLKENKKKSLHSSIQQISAQINQLGFIDPLDAEPAVIFFAQEGKK